jgi:hypothetical protein
MDRSTFFLLFCVITVATFLFSLEKRQDRARYDEFMVDCKKDLRHYECAVLWRQGV